MPETGAGDVFRTPLVLIVEEQEWTARSLESILSPHGFAVVKAYNGSQAEELVRDVHPDLCLIDLDLPDAPGHEICARIRDIPDIGKSTPVIMITSRQVDRSDRLEALRAGAWDVIRPPFDAEELVLRFKALVTAKLEADEARRNGLVDPGTGIYNVRGLLERAREWTADAARYERPLACIVFGPARAEVEKEAPLGEDAGEGPGEGRPERLIGHREAWARAIRSSTRVADTVGRMGMANFAIIAPQTDQDGVRILVNRLFDLLESSARAEETTEPEAALPGGLRAGCFTLGPSNAREVHFVDLLTRATIALRQAQSSGNGDRLRFYDPAPGSA